MTEADGHACQAYRCGKCLYPIAGLAGHICPECGSDLNEVGVARPGIFTPGLLVTVSRLFLLVIVVSVMMLIVTTCPLPRLYKYTQQSQVQLTQSKIDILSRATFWQLAPMATDRAASTGRAPFEPLISEVLFTYRPARGEVLSFTLDVQGRGYRMTQGFHAGDIDRKTIDELTDWLSSIGGPDLADEHDCDACARFALGLLLSPATPAPDMINRGWQQFVPQHSEVSHIPEIAAIVGGLLVWLLLCRMFTRRRVFLMSFDQASDISSG